MLHQVQLLGSCQYDQRSCDHSGKAWQTGCQPEDLFEAVEVVLVGKEKKDRIMNEEERRIVSYHEVGHALVSALQKDAEPVQKITIVPRTWERLDM